MDAKYTLILEDNTQVVASPMPTGWETIDISLKREPVWHGVFFDYGLKPLNFTGEAADLITAEYEANGVSGVMSLRVDVRCSDGQYIMLYTGRLNFTTYEHFCGIECGVVIEVEDTQDIIKFRNNYSQKVNVNSLIAFDQVTELTDYAALNTDITIPNRGLPQTSRGNNSGGPAVIYPITVTWSGLLNAVYIRPNYSENQLAEIETTNLDGGEGYKLNQVLPFHPSQLRPVLDIEIPFGCASGAYTYSFRLKGHIRERTNGNRTVSIHAVVTTEDDYDNILDPALHFQTLLPITNYTAANGPDLDFDVSYAGITPLSEDQRLYAFIFVVITPSATLRTSDISMDWDAETSVNIQTISQCDPTPAKMNLINETVSRISEAITNDAIRFYSTYFGRADSEPYTLEANTCGGMIALTNGLNVRQKLLVDNTQPGFFLSMQDVFEYMRRVYNIGLGIENDPQRPGFKRLRFEDWRFFYQTDFGGLVFRPDVVRKRVDPNRVYNKVLLGFTKWEAEQYSGLDEFMTTREYRTEIDAIDNGLDIQTDLITSPYTVEITRRLDTTTQDWKYDNDTFAFALLKAGPGFIVEQFQGNTTGVENVADPGTAYNGRLRPSTIAMRWFNYVIQGIKSVTSATRLIFTKGTGNYVAKLKTNSCNVEGVPIRENEDIDITDFNNVPDAQPITQPEIDSFSSPMSYNTFLRLLNEPELRMKTIKYICNETVSTGWINSMVYHMGSVGDGGTAELEVIPVNGLQIPLPEPPCDAVLGEITVTVINALDGLIEVEFVETVVGADNWNWYLFQNGAIVRGGNTNAHPFQINGLPPGEYSIGIIPRCGVNIGQNSGTANFNIESSEMEISIYAAYSPMQNRLRITVTPISGPTFTNAFTFQFGACIDDSSGTLCFGFPSASTATPTATLTAVAGATSAISFIIVTADDFATLSSVTLYNLSGIAPGQISPSIGATWTLNFE